MVGSTLAESANAMTYEITSGRIATWALEVPLVRHCNLRCEQCCTFSPDSRPWQIAPRQLERDLRAAAQVLAPHVLKLTGGEPLLHHDLEACVAVARASGISPRLSMTTNGLLARTIPRAVWAALDRLTLSVYASIPLPDKTLRLVEQRCAEHGVMLTIKSVDTFQRMTPDAPLNERLREDIHASCWLRHRCHTLSEGMFFKCTRPPSFAHNARRAPASPEGVVLDDPDLLERLHAYLTSTTPLPSCRSCLGGTGEWLAHAQKRRTRGAPGQPSR